MAYLILFFNKGCEFKLKKILSVSLGSKKRDYQGIVEIFGNKFRISRVGTDGNIEEAKKLILENDGKVAAITLGGMDRYFYVGNCKYELPLARDLAQLAKVTPIVDGSGIKNTYEKEVILYLVKKGVLKKIFDKNILIVSAVDRCGMTEILRKFCSNILYGDLIFADICDWPIKNWWKFFLVANCYLSFIMPFMNFQQLYPTGSKQEEISKNGHGKYYEWADIIVGDWHLIKKFLPMRKNILNGKIIITNTVTERDYYTLASFSGLTLVTYTLKIDRRNFGANVMEGLLVAELGKVYDGNIQKYYQLIEKLDFDKMIKIENFK